MEKAKKLELIHAIQQKQIKVKFFAENAGI